MVWGGGEGLHPQEWVPLTDSETVQKFLLLSAAETVFETLCDQSWANIRSIGAEIGCESSIDRSEEKLLFRRREMRVWRRENAKVLLWKFSSSDPISLYKHCTRMALQMTLADSRPTLRPMRWSSSPLVFALYPRLCVSVHCKSNEWTDNKKW